MFKKIGANIISNNISLARYIDDYFSKKDDIDIIGIACEAPGAERLLRESDPDILIVDLALPQLDGLTLLERIDTYELRRKPKSIVLSAFGHEDTIKRAYTLGADYFLVKPLDVEFLYQKVMDICHADNLQAQSLLTSIKLQNERITNILLGIGIPIHVLGFEFLRMAIKIVAMDPMIMHSITKRLYPKISLLCDTEVKTVERGIRNAIEIAWKRGNIDKINELYGYNIYCKKKPTNSEFIGLVAYKFQMEKTRDLVYGPSAL